MSLDYEPSENVEWMLMDFFYFHFDKNSGFGFYRTRSVEYSGNKLLRNIGMKLRNYRVSRNIDVA
jgi:hypothetical protein